MSDVTRAEFDALAAEVAALTDLMTESVVPKADRTITLLTNLADVVTDQFTKTNGAIAMLASGTLNGFEQMGTRFDTIDSALAEILRRLPPP